MTESKAICPFSLLGRGIKTNSDNKGSIKYHQNIQKYSNYRAYTKFISNKTKGCNSKSKKARVVILVRDTSICHVLHFYKVWSEYSNGYSIYRADKGFMPMPTESVPKTI